MPRFGKEEFVVARREFLDRFPDLREQILGMAIEDQCGIFEALNDIFYGDLIGWDRLEEILNRLELD